MTVRRCPAVWLGACLFAAAVTVGASAAPEQSIAITAEPVTLDPETPASLTVGALRYLGGLELDSRDRRFGGLSGLVVDADGRRFTAVSDSGWWFTGALEHDRNGRLTGLSDTRWAPLLDLTGKPIARKSHGDAESLARVPDGGFLVAFERDHRVWHYRSPDHAARPVTVPTTVLTAPGNGGIEAMATLADGRLLALSEKLTAGTWTRGWLIGGGPSGEIAYRREAGFRPTGLTRVADGTLIVLERSFSYLDGLKIRLTEFADTAALPGAKIEATEIARFEPPLLYDNFEAVAAHTAPDGTVQLYLLSDDNYRRVQSTYLFKFEMTR